MKELLQRIFVTNWKTTAAGLLVLVALGGRLAGKLDREDMSYLIGVAVSAGLLAAKDGVRSETPVAREDVPPANPE